MKEPLPDTTVLLTILATLILLFTMIFSFRPSFKDIGPSIQWKDSPPQEISTNINL